MAVYKVTHIDPETKTVVLTFCEDEPATSPFDFDSLSFVDESGREVRLREGMEMSFLEIY